MTKIKVLQCLPSMDRGGQETFVMNLFRNIDREKFQFDFLCSDKRPFDFDQEICALGGKILFLPQIKKGNKITKYFFSSRANIEFLKAIAREYDVVHLHNCHAFSFCVSVREFRKAGFANIITHSHNSNAPRPLLHKIFKPFVPKKNITRFACSVGASEWLYGKRATKKRTTENGKIANIKNNIELDKFEVCEQAVEKEKIFVINNGVELDKFAFDQKAREKVRQELNANDEFVIGHVGRLDGQKNHKFLLEIFAEVCKLRENSQLWLVGKGELENQIKLLARDLQIESKVKFLGARDNVNELLQGMDAFVFPSLFEGLSLVGQEAQASGVNVFHSGVIAEEGVFSNKCFALSLAQSPQEWAKIIVEKKCDRKATFNEKIKNYDIKNTVKMVEQIYIELANKNLQKIKKAQVISKK
ncbi:MAG: glycosyltransferase [Clostridia bacterium]